MTRRAASVELVPQAHGGSLLAGGKPGNRGGGRLRSEVRAAALEGADVGVGRLRKIVTSPRSRPALVVQAAGILLKYGLGMSDEVTLDELRSFMLHMFAIIEQECDAETAGRVIARLRDLRP